MVTSVNVVMDCIASTPPSRVSLPKARPGIPQAPITADKVASLPTICVSPVALSHRTAHANSSSSVASRRQISAPVALGFAAAYRPRSLVGVMVRLLKDGETASGQPPARPTLFAALTLASRHHSRPDASASVRPCLTLSYWERLRVIAATVLMFGDELLLRATGLASTGVVLFGV